MPTGLATVFFGLGAITYARAPRRDPRAQQAGVARAHAAVDRSVGRRGAAARRRRRAARPPWPARSARPSERRSEPARRVGRHEEVRGHHRARRRRRSTSASGELVGLIGPNGAGQDDVLQLPARHAATRRRLDHVRRQGPDAGADAPAGPARHRPHVPAHRAVRRDDRRASTSSSPTGPAAAAAACGRTRSGAAGRSTDEQDRADAMLELLGLARRRRPQGRVAEPRRRPARRGRPGADDRAASCCCSTSRRRVSTATRPRTLAETLDDVQRERGIAILLVEHDVEFVRAFVAAGLRARLRHAHRVGPHRRGVRRRRGAPGVPRRPRVMARAPHERRTGPRSSRSSSCATSTPATGRSARCSTSRSRSQPGRVLALLGSNGAGKTTIARVCSGLVAPTRGAVRFDGEDVTGAPPYQFARRGIVHAPEGRSVFASLTVEENLELTFRRSARPSAGAAPRSTRPTRSSRGSVSGAGSSRARSRAVSSACSRSRGCSSRSRGC